MSARSPSPCLGGGGAALEMQAVAVDGIQATERAKCASRGCEEPPAFAKTERKLRRPDRVEPDRFR